MESLLLEINKFLLLIGWSKFNKGIDSFCSKIFPFEPILLLILQLKLISGTAFESNNNI